MGYVLDFSMEADVGLCGAAYVGVDPGKTGYAAVVTRQLVEAVYPVPLLPCGSFDLEQICRIVRLWKARGVLGVVIERQRSAYLPPQARAASKLGSGGAAYGNFLVTASFVLGEAFMCWKMACCVVGLRYCTVLPVVWRKALGLASPRDVPVDKRREASKAASIALCQTLFPNVELKRTSRCARLSPDIAEAVLLGHAGFENFDEWLRSEAHGMQSKVIRKTKKRRATGHRSKISV